MYKFNLSRNSSLINKIRSPKIYEYNLAKNLALLSDDPAVIRQFFQVEQQEYFGDLWIVMQAESEFLSVYRPGQAWAYFGIIPMIVRAKVGLVASGGFTVTVSETVDKKINNYLDEVKENIDLQKLFSDGVYWESGIGDFAYRISYAPDLSQRPLIDIIEPQNLEINYNRGKVVSYVVKEVSDKDPEYQLHEIHYLNSQGFNCISYKFFYKKNYVPDNDYYLIEQCKQYFENVDITDRVLPFKGFVTIVYKQNSGSNKLYGGLRGVPDIQGIDSIEDKLTEAISDLMDAIRKAGVKEYIDDDLISEDIDGKKQAWDSFNKTIIYTKGSANPQGVREKHRVVQGEIRWEAHKETIQMLMSTAINKAGLSPTTLGLTGLESINSSSDSQEAREKTSIRTRALALKSWTRTLTELFAKYLAVDDYINGVDQSQILGFESYRKIIKIDFDEYLSPTPESITEVLAMQVQAGLKSKTHAIMDLNKEYDEQDANNELQDILAENGQMDIAEIAGDIDESMLIQDETMGIPPSESTKGNWGVDPLSTVTE